MILLHDILIVYTIRIQGKKKLLGPIGSMKYNVKGRYIA
jgi:hypothetical protein